jgi:hypothetical protein
MSIINVLNKLEPILHEIELNTIQINQHTSNANMAKTGAALTYLITDNSKNSNIRTIGQVASIGGLVYANSHQNQANGIESKNLLLISKILDLVEREGMNYIKLEKDTNIIGRFIQLNLNTGKHLDLIVLKYSSRIKSKGRLGKKNINILINAINIDAFNCKLRLNRIYKILDSSKQIPSLGKEFTNDTKLINIDKVIQEGLHTRLIIFSLLFFGIFTIQFYQISVLLIFFGLLFWGINHYFPFFSETRKLKQTIDNFIIKLNLTCQINTLYYR